MSSMHYRSTFTKIKAVSRVHLRMRRYAGLLWAGRELWPPVAAVSRQFTIIYQNITVVG